MYANLLLVSVAGAEQERDFLRNFKQNVDASILRDNFNKNLRIIKI